MLLSSLQWDSVCGRMLACSSKTNIRIYMLPGTTSSTDPPVITISDWYQLERALGNRSKERLKTSCLFTALQVCCLLWGGGQLQLRVEKEPTAQ